MIAELRRPLTVITTALLLGLAATASHPARAQSSDQVTRPIEVLVIVRDQAPRCEPQELRVPAQANIDLRIQNQGTRSVAIQAPDLFKDDAVRGATGATQQGNDAYVVQGGQNAQMIVLTPPRGQYRFACTSPGTAAGEMTGTLTAVR